MKSTRYLTYHDRKILRRLRNHNGRRFDAADSLGMETQEYCADLKDAMKKLGLPAGRNGMRALMNKIDDMDLR